MSLDRREFLHRTGIALTAGVVPAAASAAIPVEEPAAAADPVWDPVRRAFALSPDLIHMSAMLFASHPATVRAAIDLHRRGLDADPAGYLHDNNGRLTGAAFAAAARYLGADAADVALTDSTTMGAGLVYGCLSLRPGQEILSTEQDYYVTHEAIRAAAKRSGATVRLIPLYDAIETASADALVAAIATEITPATRVLALTWVHSSTGLKLPLPAIAAAVRAANRNRDVADHVLLAIDGVHGFGSQDFVFADLGCDFLFAGCHKWLFGPRGTGLVAASRKGYDAIIPPIPTFSDDRVFNAWLWRKGDPEGRINGRTLSPGGFKTYEHLWALPEAFAFHDAIGKARVAERTAELALHLKEGLARMPHVRLLTPRDAALSAGIVSFDLDSWTPQKAVRHLRERRIVASVAPYTEQHVRITPSILNTPAEVDIVLAEVAAMAD